MLRIGSGEAHTVRLAMNPIRNNPSERSGRAVWLGTAVLAALMLACITTLPWTLSKGPDGVPRYNSGTAANGRTPPFWTGAPDNSGRFWLGSDVLGRSVLIRCLTGGGISLGIGVCAAVLAVVIGTLYGAASGYAGGRLDGVMMRTVDVLYGLPYVLLVVLLAVAGDALTDEYVSRQQARSQLARELLADAHMRTNLQTDTAASAVEDPLTPEAWQIAAERLPVRHLSASARQGLDLGVLLIAIGGVSWLTLARVVRGQVLSLKNQPFVLAARAMGASPARVFFKHLLPNLRGTIVVFATLTIPQAILQESFLSFLGIGVKPPLPSWGTLIAEGLGELNPYASAWWLLLFPCLLLGSTLLALNFVGEGLRGRVRR